LGYPTVRAVESNRPDDDGTIDRTTYMGSRAVAATVMVLSGAGARIDDVADNFAPYMVPSARPVLHYVLDRAGAGERTITLRPAGYGWKVEGDSQREVQLAWVASDPTVYDPVLQTITAYAGSTTQAGRVYPLTFPRVYPSGGGAATSARLRSYGELPVSPLCRIYGPITAPRVYFAAHPGDGTQQNSYVTFQNTLSVNAGDWVDVDTNAKTAYRNSDYMQSVFGLLNFANTIWPVLPASPVAGPTPYTDITVSGTGTMNNVTQVQVSWHDGYLT